MEQGYLERQKQHFFLFFLSFQFKEILYNDNRQEQQQKRQFNNSKIVSIDKRSEEKKRGQIYGGEHRKGPCLGPCEVGVEPGIQGKGEQSKKQILCNALTFRMASERTFFSAKGHEQILERILPFLTLFNTSMAFEPAGCSLLEILLSFSFFFFFHV